MPNFQDELILMFKQQQAQYQLLMQQQMVLLEALDLQIFNKSDCIGSNWRSAVGRTISNLTIP